MKETTIKYIESINKNVYAFIKRSNLQQGYIAIEFCNGIDFNSWGEARWRFQSSGAENGFIYFKDLKELDDKIKRLLSMSDEELQQY
jgi:hypothetical protein